MRRAGFTLLELLAAFTLVSVLAGSLFVALRTGIQARRASRAALMPARLTGLSFDMLNRDLQCAPPPRGILAGPFTGETGEVTFYTRPMRTTDGAAGIARVSYALLEPDENGESALVRRLVTNLLALEEPEPAEEILCRGVLELSFSYFDGLNWLEAWDSVTMADTVPRAVEVRLLVAAPGSAGAGPAGHEFRRRFLLPASEAVPLEVEAGAEEEFDE